MNILVSGSTGLVGTALVPLLIREGHTVTRLVRKNTKVKEAPAEGKIYWDPEGGILEKNALNLFEGVVHLAGENLAARRWNPPQKARILESRVKATRLISETLAQQKRPPRVLVSASAVGYYGDRGEELLDEASGSGSGFLAEVCRQWEAATRPAVEKGVRVVNLRIGFVLSPAGGGLAKMLLPFRLGLGGRVGNGRQYMSWIALDELVAIMARAVADESLRGPVNAVSPNPVQNAEFTKVLGKVLGRPTVFPMPAFAARMAFGEMANELLLAGQRAKPARLLDSGYTFRYPNLEDALRHMLRK